MGFAREGVLTMAEARIGYCALGDTVAGLGLANDAAIEVDIVVCPILLPVATFRHVQVPMLICELTGRFPRFSEQ